METVVGVVALTQVAASCPAAARCVASSGRWCIRWCRVHVRVGG